ncbi:MAG: Flp pilus assembly complex ATPase component TadA [Phycisphaerae bacterium]|nr:Flp pilus assembly complex ATPase component TadA [Phycisphaerae bacterium]
MTVGEAPFSPCALAKNLGPLTGLDEGVWQRVAESPKPPDVVILDELGAAESDLLPRLAALLNAEYLPRVDARCVAPEFLRRVPLFLAQRLGLLLMQGSAGGEPRLVMCRPLDVFARNEALRLLGRPSCRLAVAPRTAVLATLSAAAETDGGLARSVACVIEEDEHLLIEEVERLAADTDLLDLANKAPVIQLVNRILLEAVRMRASDVHIQPCPDRLQIRMRVDGVLHNVVSAPRSLLDAVVSRVKVMAGMDIAERRLAQDGRATVTVGQRDVDLRISTVPASYGERGVLRLLDKGARLYQLEELGMGPEHLSLFRRLISHTHGILLVTGPTGSGKTTTLYAALQHVNAEELNVITLEDPIEYQLDGISQIQVGRRKGMTFAGGLRSVLRQDPDVIMVGEIRDQETARMAIQSALTGHMVYSTLHTNDSASAATRLVDIGVEPYLVASSVVGVLAQRLVRRVCPHCRRLYEPAPEVLQQAGVRRVPGQTFYRGQGCQECLGGGYLERVGIYELLVMDDPLRQLILEKAPASRLKQAALEAGLVTLRMDGVRKAIEGQTTIEEVLRVTQTDSF